MFEPPKVDFQMRAAQTSKKYLGNPFWVFAGFVAKISGANVLPVLPFLGFMPLFFGVLVSVQKKMAWGTGADGGAFWIGFALVNVAVYIVGRAFSGDKATEITPGDAVVPLLVLLPGIFLDPFWGSLITLLALGIVSLGAWVAMRSRGEAGYYVLAIVIFLVTVWVSAVAVAWTAKGFGRMGWSPFPVDVEAEKDREFEMRQNWPSMLPAGVPTSTRVPTRSSTSIGVPPTMVGTDGFFLPTPTRPGTPPSPTRAPTCPTPAPGEDFKWAWDPIHGRCVRVPK